MADNTKTLARHWYDTAIVWLIYGLGAGIPLVFSTALYSNFAEPKLLLLRIVTLLILLLWTWKSFVEEKITWRPGKFGLVLLAYGCVLVVTTLASMNIFTSLFGSETRFLGLFTQLNFLLAAWLVYNFLTTKRELKTFITVICCTGIVLLMVYGFLQYFGAFQDTFFWSQNPQERVFGTLGHSDHFGAYMGMCLLLSFGVVPFMKNKFFQRLLVACAHAAFIVILLTGSRGALAATVLSLLVVWGIIVVRNENLRSFLKKFWWSFVLVFALMAGLVFAFREPLGKLPVIQRLERGAVTAADGYPPDRLSWWYSSFDMFKDRPLLGSGVSTFRDMYNKYRRYDYKVPGPGDLQYQITPESSHDDYIDILVTEGLLGLAVYLSLLVTVFAAVDKKILSKEKPDELFYLTLGIKGALMVYLIQALVNFGVVDTLAIFFMLIGAAMSAVSVTEKLAEISLKVWIKTISVFFAFIVLIFGGVSSVREAAAEYDYKNAIVAEANGKPDESRAWYEGMIKMQTGRYEYYEAFADFAFKNATAAAVDPKYAEQYLELALQNYQKASVLNNFHPSTFYNMGVTSIQLGHLQQSDAYTEQGLNDLQQAIVLSPNNPLYAYQSAKVFRDVGRTDLAMQALNTVVRIDPQFMDAQKRLDEIRKKN